jgi:hypothetical protein
MRVLEAQGTKEVARLLRALAEEVERGTAEIDGRVFDVSSSLRALIEFPEDANGEVTRLDLHLWHPAPTVWDLTELRIAMSHSGD